jgi:hypothetical protein
LGITTRPDASERPLHMLPLAAHRALSHPTPESGRSLTSVFAIGRALEDATSLTVEESLPAKRIESRVVPHALAIVAALANTKSRRAGSISFRMR